MDMSLTNVKFLLSVFLGTHDFLEGKRCDGLSSIRKLDHHINYFFLSMWLQENFSNIYQTITHPRNYHVQRL